MILLPSPRLVLPAQGPPFWCWRRSHRYGTRWDRSCLSVL